MSEFTEEEINLPNCYQMVYDCKKTFKNLDLRNVSEYEIEEFGEELPEGMIYWERDGKKIGFLWDSNVCIQFDADMFFEDFYNFIYDIKENMEIMWGILL
jgi:hypothetical protein